MTNLPLQLKHQSSWCSTKMIFFTLQCTLVLILSFSAAFGALWLYFFSEARASEIVAYLNSLSKNELLDLFQYMRESAMTIAAVCTTVWIWGKVSFAKENK